MSSKYFLVLVLFLLNPASACLGISPNYKDLKVIANQQSTTSFMFSNGCDVPVVAEISTNANYLTPEASRIVIQPKSDLAVTFIISPLAAGTYNLQIAGKILGTTSGTGMGLNSETGANLKITAGAEQTETQKPLDTTVVCGDGKCYYQERDNCPLDCPPIDSGFDITLIIGIVVAIIVVAGVYAWWKRTHY